MNDVSLQFSALTVSFCEYQSLIYRWILSAPPSACLRIDARWFYAVTEFWEDLILLLDIFFLL